MTLQDKAIDIKGKKYVLVSDRVNFFNEVYPGGMIQTKLISSPDADMVVMMAKVTPDSTVLDRYFTGYSQATWGDGMVNKTAALENCETSAVGRALGFMGIGVIDSIASADELTKATSQPAYVPKMGSDKGLYCDYHKCEMKLNKNGKPYHMDRTRPEGDQFCNGLGFKGDRKDMPGFSGTFDAIDSLITRPRTTTLADDALASLVAEEMPF